MRHFLLFSVLALASWQADAQSAEGGSIKDRMSAEQFRAAGLHKLSEAELKQLDAWFSGEKTVVVEKVVERTVEVEKKEDTSDINSNVIGEFRGWRGYTEFNLANGQVWTQAEAGALYTSKLTDPKVRIVHSNFSGWKLQVEGYNSWIKVKRVK
ncbi:hypothetical protein GCM10010960_05740 [Arenimonas maotaiensis]|uniref:Secreted protein n=1 Tax=Arenimonas maotaiensis TaxID=1446479 RepID=A0A917FJP0_9GAMM|nr:hypothetical protein [Arenimonas maotaiensis]GGF86635.1 hypothetical protein GCM10010960_05740 [Arenimonas maotaiensis]